MNRKTLTQTITDLENDIAERKRVLDGLKKILNADVSTVGQNNHAPPGGNANLKWTPERRKRFDETVARRRKVLASAAKKTTKKGA